MLVNHVIQESNSGYQRYELKKHPGLHAREVGLSIVGISASKSQNGSGENDEELGKSR